jgi:hypothetical protein
MHHRDTPIPLVGLDIETEFTTGEPKLLGYSYADGYYQSNLNPSLTTLFYAIKGILENQPRGTQIATWGNLDINCIIRLFDPQPNEQIFTSRGFMGKYRNGKWITKPPIVRQIGNAEFSVDHYISSKSLRLAVVENSRCRTIWIYNISQFYPKRIGDTAKSLEYDWQDFDTETHLIDWDRFDSDSDYKKDVLKSNEQDARSVRMMADHLQTIFHEVFNAYPSLLVSAGSLADAAVSKMLTQAEYESNSWQYLKYSTFGLTPTTQLAESIISEAYSAGYVDQFTIGYHPTAFTADISSAYPDKIRKLPDLRECYLIAGHGNPERAIKKLESDFFTVVCRGTVTIPESLEYHPITIKTNQRQNIRPIGTFRASYYLEEREFCEQNGASFEHEEWVIVALKNRSLAPIANVSLKLADMREDYRHRMQLANDPSETTFYDSLQNMIKVVDNSLYGKFVMATEVFEVKNGKPEIVGLKAGDRYNQLYAGWITALTRIQVAQACMDIQHSGGQPVLAMTDAIYWTGSVNNLPSSVVAYNHKTAGMFEPPEKIDDLFVVKTGQYEYSKPSSKSPTGKLWFHKMRGLNLPYEARSDSESFYRTTIKNWLRDNPTYHPDDVQIPVDTRKLITIGMVNQLENLGLVSDGIAMMKPFIMSGKQVERYFKDFQSTLDSYVRLGLPVAQQSDMDSPLEFLSGLNERGGEYLTRHERKRMFYFLIVKTTGMGLWNRFNGKMPPDILRLNDCTWQQLEDWSGIKREWCHI